MKFRYNPQFATFQMCAIEEADIIQLNAMAKVMTENGLAFGCVKEVEGEKENISVITVVMFTNDQIMNVAKEAKRLTQGEKVVL